MKALALTALRILWAEHKTELVIVAGLIPILHVCQALGLMTFGG